MKKILIIQTAFIGDVILSTALIEKWHQSYPESKIDVLVRKGNEALLDNNPLVNQLHVWDKKAGKYKNLFKMIKVVRKERYELVLNLQRFMASGLLTIFSKGKETRGFDKNPLAFRFSKKFPHEVGEGIHEIDRNNSLIEDLTNSERVLPKLYPTKEDLSAIRKFQQHTYVTMAPTSVWFTKQLPFKKWIELINMVPVDFHINLLGAPADRKYCDRLIKESNRENLINLCGEVSLIQSAALMKEAEMNYMNDSAPLHLASSMNAKTCVFFCSTIPDFGFGPLSDKALILEAPKEVDCRPCGLHGKKECPHSHFKCALDIKLKTNLDE